MDDKVFFAALAGLLHDVGKLEQRSQVDPWSMAAGFAREGRAVHATWTAYFIEHHLNEKYRTQYSSVVDDGMSILVALADKLSAGERADVEEASHPKSIPWQMISIFDQVNLDGQTKREGSHYYPLEALALDVERGMGEEVIFPHQAPDEKNPAGKYAKLRDIVRTAAGKNIPQKDLFLENLLFAFQRAAWCVPSAYYASEPDISLYDHSRMTAALAACLCKVNRDEIQDILAAVERNFANKATSGDEQIFEKPLAQFIEGDISGVQDFIYTISSRGAASALRGRSFYLQMLSEAIARYVLVRLGLPYTNLIYAGGGHFYILAHLSQASEIENMHKDISRLLLQHHRGQLYVGLVSSGLKVSDFFKGNMSRRWQESGEKMAVVKQRRFAELGEDISQLFSALGDGGNEDRLCQVCGMEHSRTEADEQNADGVRKCPPCLSYEKLGDELRKADFILLRQVPHKTGWKWDPQLPAGECLDVLNDFGVDLRLEEDIHPGDPKEDGYRYYALNENAYDRYPNLGNTFLVRRFMVNVTPILRPDELKYLREKDVQDLPDPYKSHVKPFAAMAVQAQGIPRLGILRMDVDNLGRIFSEGLKGCATLSRMAALSFSINVFFEGWVEVLAMRRNKLSCKNNADRGDLLYSIYSGGDDLFFIGAWDEIVEFARQVQADFRKFSAGHPAMHVSAGIVLIPQKYPLAQAAQDALAAESQAKSYLWYDGALVSHKKNALSFLGQAISWERFGLEDCPVEHENPLGSVHSLMHFLKAMLEDDAGKKNLLHRLITFHGMYRAAEKQRREQGQGRLKNGAYQTLWGPWQWQGFYTLSRMMQGSRQSEYLLQVKELRDLLKEDHFRSLEWVGLAARWTELFIRKS